MTDSCLADGCPLTAVTRGYCHRCYRLEQARDAAATAACGAPETIPGHWTGWARPIKAKPPTRPGMSRRQADWRDWTIEHSRFAIERESNARR